MNVKHLLDEFVGWVAARFGEEALASSAAAAGGPEVVARQLERLGAVELDTVVEIGTRHGVMAALLSRFAERVITIDISESPIVREVLACAKAGNVVPVVVHSDRDKGLLLEALDFDLAFVDGDHHLEAVAFDFAHVQRCGRVLFHDYGDPRYEGVTAFVDSLAEGCVDRDPPFAWWREHAAQRGA
jgi:tRNA A58 N-methylase Trm61